MRALEWAHWRANRGDYKEPFVVGAIIDLGHCLDLIPREDIEILHEAYLDFLKVQKKSGLPMPVNKSARGQRDVDRLLRYLDCAVVKHLHSIIGDTDPYDTVRGMFTEGGKLYPKSGFKTRTHVQIAVRNMACIKGLFIPHPYPATQNSE